VGVGVSVCGFVFVGVVCVCGLCGVVCCVCGCGMCVMCVSVCGCVWCV